MSDRRQLFARAGAAALGAMITTSRADAAVQSLAAPDLAPAGAHTLADLLRRLAAAPGRRDYKRVPMILTDRGDWDHEALAALLAYRGGPKQVWDHTDLAGPWLNLMRNVLNTQVWSFAHPDVLAVSATHGPAHVALFDDYVWDKYKIAASIGAKVPHNTFIQTPAAAAAPVADFESPAGVFSPADNSVTVLQRRGVVFLACHNAIWEYSAGLLKKGVNPDKLDHEQLAAELTNHLIPGAVLTPGVVGTVLELQVAGFNYAK